MNALLLALVIGQTTTYDMGMDASPVAAGAIQIRTSTTYVSNGYGWSGATPSATDRSGSDLERDFCFGSTLTFLANCANGTYSVTVYMGDKGAFPKEQMNLSIEGEFKQTVNTSAGQVLALTYEVVITDGTLTVEVVDTGGASPNGVLNGVVLQLLEEEEPPPLEGIEGLIVLAEQQAWTQFAILVAIAWLYGAYFVRLLFLFKNQPRFW